MVRKRRKKVAYTGRAKDFVRRNPGLLEEFKKAANTLWNMKPGTRIKVGNTTVEKFRKKYLAYTRYFVVEHGREKFFVKWLQPAHPFKAGAISQIGVMHEAEGILRKHGIQPMQYELGFEGRHGSFLVARFHGLERLVEISDSGVVAEAEKKMDAASKELLERGIHDLVWENIFFDPKNKKLIAFDLYRLKH